MQNEYMKSFMDHYPYEGLTFDDVSLVTQYADFLPSETDTHTRFSRNIKLSSPFVSAAMDTVTEAKMAIAMAQMGGIGVIHKNLSPEDQMAKVRRVKHYLNGFIREPIAIPFDMTVSEMLARKERKQYGFSGFPVMDAERNLVGIITARDVKFITDYSCPVSEVMTPLERLITAPENTDLNEAFRIMREHKIGKLPTVSADGKLTGLYSFQDVRMLIEKNQPCFSRDQHHRLRVAAAVGPYDEKRISLLVGAEIDAVVIDTAHGHSKGVIETVKWIKNNFGGRVDVVAGNIATAEAAKALMDAGVDAVKVGIGPGSICTTRVVAGVGIPQISAVWQARKVIGDEIPIIADGGIKQSGDVAKAIAVGASTVMMGSALAGTDESPGEKIFHHGRRYVIYRGMGSLEAMRKNKGSRERYGQADVDAETKLVPQGVEGLVLYRGCASEVMTQYIGGLNYSLGYCGTRTIQELQTRAKFVRVSAAGLREAHPHDIQMTKDAPNYMIK